MMGAIANILALAITVLFAITVYFLVRSWHEDSKARKHGCYSPQAYPHNDPFLGVDLFLNTGKAIQEHRYLPELTKRYNTLGNTFSTKSLGCSSINSIEPENIKAVFLSNFNDWGVEQVRLPAQEPFCGRGFITTDGPAWEHSRSLLRPSFTRRNAVDLPVLETYLKDVIERIPKDGSTVDLQPLLFSLYLATATSFLFGESINSLSGDTSAEAQIFLKAFDHSMLGSGIQIALGPFKFLYPYMDSQWLESCKVTHQFAEKYVNKALQYRQTISNQDPQSEKEAEISRKPYVLLDGIAEQTGDKTELRNEILQALMAAQETTAALISNVFFLLSRNQAIWEQLRKDVLALGDEDLNQESLQGIRHLRNVLNETLRLYPVFPQMNRVARVDTILPKGGGPNGNSPIFAPAGTGFDTSWYNLHRLKSVWGEDTDKFKPDRWETFKPDAWQYVPFGGGPRSCLGRTKALVEASYVIVRIMQEFGQIESRDDREWEGQVQLTAKNANGCKIALISA